MKMKDAPRTTEEGKEVEMEAEKTFDAIETHLKQALALLELGLSTLTHSKDHPAFPYVSEALVDFFRLKTGSEAAKSCSSCPPQQKDV